MGPSPASCAPVVPLWCSTAGQPRAVLVRGAAQWRPRPVLAGAAVSQALGPGVPWMLRPTPTCPAPTPHHVVAVEVLVGTTLGRRQQPVVARAVGWELVVAAVAVEVVGVVVAPVRVAMRCRWCTVWQPLHPLEWVPRAMARAPLSALLRDSQSPRQHLSPVPVPRHLWASGLCVGEGEGEVLHRAPWPHPPQPRPTSL